MRSIIAGGTNYTGQSFQDLLDDLLETSGNLKKWRSELEVLQGALASAGYWGRVPVDLRSALMGSLKVVDTALLELPEIAEDLKYRVREDHVRRLSAIARSAGEVERRLGGIWHADPLMRFQAENRHNEPELFQQLQKLYADSRDTLLYLLDLEGLGLRLEDFVGKERRPVWWSRLLAWMGDHVAQIAVGVIVALIVTFLLIQLGVEGGTGD